MVVDLLAPNQFACCGIQGVGEALLVGEIGAVDCALDITARSTPAPNRDGRANASLCRERPVHAAALRVERVHGAVLGPQPFQRDVVAGSFIGVLACLLYTSPSPRDRQKYRM